MKNKLTLAIFLAFSFIILTGCKKTTVTTCDLATATTRPPVEMNIIYTATQTGDGSIASLTYATISGTVTVENPQLPWTVTVPVLTSTNVIISASGSTNNGSVKITYEGNSGSATIQGSDYCEHQAD